MFGLLTLVSGFLTIKQLIKEKTEPVAPKGTRFDMDAYYEDIRNGIGAMEQVRKCERGGYMTTKPATPKWYELPLDTVVDEARYNHDKEFYGETITESWRKNGSYRYMKKF